MNTEYTTIKIERFKSPDGQPACCIDWVGGKTCKFLGVRHFGSFDVCMLGEQRDLQRQNGNGYIRPDLKCQVWIKSL